MISLAHALRIKYGLHNDPSDAQIKKWVDRVHFYIDTEGKAGEESGLLAAKEVFSEYGSMAYFSEADTILALLAAAEKK
ncbi:MULTISPECIES: hypothetical protein [Pseudanabaena]|jgi:hypothetical protein|uniref:hypothetical protein n=1 Tax=Pseudanabaena TaxID=1152 RepID=UPI002478CD14|nr:MULTISPECIES: hypothetical protein [Pseudanabaena]MEA5486447.1 hypothetical protein [Pseudanabaena sp. CCNP1317]WGS72712.1 hypothetical protein OA858_01405 [Pseudanabaena galeata CCNP1313]